MKIIFSTAVEKRRHPLQAKKKKRKKCKTKQNITKNMFAKTKNRSISKTK